MKAHATSAAVVVGIDRYPDPAISDLRGAVADARAMRALLVEHFHFPTDRVVTLYDDHATAERIGRAFDWLGRTVGPTGSAVFFFAGHGALRYDDSGDEADGFDETIVPHDSGRRGRPDRDLTDDWLRTRIEALVERAADVTLVFDCCHSGTLGRESPGGYDGVRQAPDGQGAIRGGGPALRPVGGALPYVLLAATAAGQLSHERVDGADGRSRGVFTRALVEALSGSTADDSWRTIMARVGRAVRALEPGQHPQLEGSGRDRRPFSTALPHSRWALAEADGADVRVALGTLHGVEPGQRLTLSPLTGGGGDPAAAGSTLRARVVDLGPLSCRCVLEAPPAPARHRGPSAGPLRALPPPGAPSLWTLAKRPAFAPEQLSLIFDADAVLDDDGAHVVYAGDSIALAFDNQGGTRLHLALLLLDGDGAVSVALPEPGSDFELAPFTRHEETFDAELPPERPDGDRWRLVLIAASAPFDPRPLEGGGRSLIVPPEKDLALALYRMVVRIVPAPGA